MEKTEKDRLHKYIFLFESIFKKKNIQDAFMSHLKTEMNTEPFQFLLEVEQLHKQTEIKEIKVTTKTIVEKYFNENSKVKLIFQENIPKNFLKM